MSNNSNNSNPRYCQVDGGKSTSKRPRQNNDCSVIATATALGMTYDDAYDEMARLGRQPNGGPKWKKILYWLCKHPRLEICYVAYGLGRNTRIPKHSRSVHETSVNEFIAAGHPGVYILWTANNLTSGRNWKRSHLTVVRNGVRHDVWDSTEDKNDTVMGVWKVVN